MTIEYKIKKILHRIGEDILKAINTYISENMEEIKEVNEIEYITLDLMSYPLLSCYSSFFRQLDKFFNVLSIPAEIKQNLKIAFVERNQNTLKNLLDELEVLKNQIPQG